MALFLACIDLVYLYVSHDELAFVIDEQGNRLRHEHLVGNTYIEPYVPCSVPVEIVKNANCSSGPHLNVVLGECSLSNTCNSTDGTDNFLRINESEEQYILGSAGENLSGEVTDKIAGNTTNGLRHEAIGSFDHELERMDVGSEKDLFSSGICQDMGPEQTPLNRKNGSANNNGNGQEGKDSDGFEADDYDSNTCGISHRLENCETALIEGESSEAEAVCQVQGHTPNAKECCLQSEFDYGPSIAVGKNLESGCSLSEEDYFMSKAGHVEDEISGNNAVSQSNEACRIGLLEEIIDEAKTNKVLLALVFGY